MASTDASSESTSGTQSALGVDMNLEVVTLPVSDVDRAKSFYQSLGWRLRHRPGRQRRSPDGAVHAAPLRSARSSSARAAPRLSPGPPRA